MDDIGNIVYIILMLIALVGSVLRKKKKQEDVFESDPEAGRKSGNYDPFAEDDFEIETETTAGQRRWDPAEAYGDHKHAEAMVSEGEAVDMAGEAERLQKRYDEHMARLQRRESEIVEGENAIPDELGGYSAYSKKPALRRRKILRDFKLKHAILYAEIINRKYI